MKSTLGARPTYREGDTGVPGRESLRGSWKNIVTIQGNIVKLNEPILEERLTK